MGINRARQFPHLRKGRTRGWLNGGWATYRRDTTRACARAPFTRQTRGRKHRWMQPPRGKWPRTKQNRRFIKRYGSSYHTHLRSSKLTNQMWIVTSETRPLVLANVETRFVRRNWWTPRNLSERAGSRHLIQNTKWWLRESLNGMLLAYPRTVDVITIESIGRILSIRKYFF